MTIEDVRKMSDIYTVRLVRPVFQSVSIEVQALNRNSAMQKALRRATVLPESDWIDRQFEDCDNMVHVEAVLDNQKVYETSANPHQEISEFRSVDGNSDNFKYLILAADLSTRVGRVLPQPWFTSADQMLQADLCSDWVEPFSFILENDGLDGDITQMAVGWEMPGNDNVIEFPTFDLDQDQEEVESKT